MTTTLPATARSISLARQAIISGSVQDSLTGEAPRGILSVRLIDLDSGDDYPLAGKVLADGSFAFYAAPEKAFPRLAEQTYHLHVEANAPRYTSASFDFDVGPVAGQPAMVSVPVPTSGMDDIQVLLFTGGGLPRTDLSLTLDREAVRLEGRVVVSTDPAAGVPNATVQQNPPGGDSTTTDADGYFVFPNPLPVVLSLQLRASATDFEDSTLAFEPDYTRPTNQITVPLKPS